MAADRVAELLGDVKHNRRQLTSPEGVALDIRIATVGERLTAFILDLMLMYGAIAVVCFLGVFFAAKGNAALVMTIALFASFVIRNVYFMHFELATQGRTPGKRMCGIRVVNRAGGELTPGAVIARNLTREAEFFLPLTLAFGLDSSLGVGWQAALLGWAVLFASLPLWNRDRLRAGDVVAGTQVIAMPRQRLSYDISLDAGAGSAARYRFTDEQLSVYGVLELQVLEELLRRPPTSPETKRLLAGVCEKIRAKIGWKEKIPAVMIRTFLNEFYAAERAFLERGQLFGKFRSDKNAAPDKRRRR